MPATTIDVSAPSRLHFGLLSFGQKDMLEFGGIGAMISQPGLHLRISPAERFEIRGPLAERVRAVVARRAGRLGESTEPACRVEVFAAPPEHVGLGTGTQLSLAVAAGLNAWEGRAALDPAALANLAGRGLRSAVGTHGFFQGGLLFETGKCAVRNDSTDLQLAPLESRVALCDSWRFVLICLAESAGLSGDEERSAFRDLPPVPLDTTANLLKLVREELLPSAVGEDFERFSESLYRYGHMAGMCFAARQGGPFASPAIAALVARIRELGVQGVGQSSWGPTVFALLPNEAEARSFAREITTGLGPHTLHITAPDNRGAQIRAV